MKIKSALRFYLILIRIDILITEVHEYVSKRNAYSYWEEYELT